MTDDESERERLSATCPLCGESGFDGQGKVTVQGIEMYLRQCWNCGLRFATQTWGLDDD